MSESIRVRPARGVEVPMLSKLIRGRLPDMMGGVKKPSMADIETHLRGLILDEALILATRGRHLAGLIAVGLDRAQILACYLDPKVAGPDTTARLFEAAEQLALSFGMRTLHCEAKAKVSGFVGKLGYQPADREPAGRDTVVLGKNLLDIATADQRRLLVLQDELGIPEDYGVKHRLRLTPVVERLVSVGADIFGRDQRLQREAAEAWRFMRTGASQHGIELQLVSAYRAVNYQASIVRRKIEAGEPIGEILKTSAAPGYSEHHTGRAIDISTPGSRPLQAEFGDTPAYRWLKANAGTYGFHESYPMGNRHGIEWEPWHWCYRRQAASERKETPQFAVVSSTGR